MATPQIHLDLAPSEAAVLDQGLDAMLRETRFELARTDDRQYRADVRARLEVLESIQGKLSTLLQSPGES